MNPNIMFDNIKTELEFLNRYNATPGCGITRMVFSEEDIGARGYIKELMEQIGMEVREDAIGNIFGTLEGEDKNLSPVWSGSHIDTVRNGGMFDGMVGVIGALEACRWIKENSIAHKRNIVVVVYTSEEPTRFGYGCIGSHALTGHLTLEKTKELKDDAGESLYDILKRLGYPLSEYGNIQKKRGDIFAHVEMHIEQADKLEIAGLPIGVVEGICAPSYISVDIKGTQEHAGSTQMAQRRDALCATSEIILEVEKTAKMFNDFCENATTVGTVGKLQILPNSPNVIPGKTSFMIDIRDVDNRTKDRFVEKILEKMDKIALKRGIHVEYHLVENDIPRKSDEKIVKVIEESCKKLKVDYMKMVSGAYHDSLLIAEIAPMAMIFVPSKDGISHDPAEYTEYSDIVTGTRILADTLVTLANAQVL